MKPYKQLRKNLCKKFENPYNHVDGYDTMGAIGHWVNQSGIKCTDEHVHILCKIYGSVFYPYQKADRKTILKYLKNNKEMK